MGPGRRELVDPDRLGTTMGKEGKGKGLALGSVVPLYGSATEMVPCREPTPAATRLSPEMIPTGAVPDPA